MENKVNDKRLVEVSNTCSDTHGKLQGNLKEVQKCLEEAKVVFQFCLKWTISTRRIKK